MPPPAMLGFEDGLAHNLSDNEWQGFRVFPRENPNTNTNPTPNFNFLVKKAILQNEKSTSPLFSRTLAKDDSFRMVLPPAMPPPRDSAVPLPMLPEPMRIRKKLSHQESFLFMRKSHYSEKILYKEEDFKCNAFCLSLPGFGKHKPVVRSSSKRQDLMEKKMIRASSFAGSTVSIRASLEKFECGSWASTTALIQDNGRLFHDFPVEMTKCNSRGGNRGRDVQEPVTSGFLFDRETETLALRSVLKTRSTRDHRRSAETSPQRRVRFSTSSSSASVSCPTSPRTCITPRLRKARDDFNTFLTAQNA